MSRRKIVLSPDDRRVDHRMLAQAVGDRLRDEREEGQVHAALGVLLLLLGPELRHAGVVDLEDRVHVRRDPARHHHVLGGELADPATRARPDRPPRARPRQRGAGARGCGAAAAGAGAGAAGGCSHRRRAARRRRFEVSDHVVLGDPPREPGARNGAQYRGRARRPSCAPAGWSGAAAAPRRSPPRRCAGGIAGAGPLPRRAGRRGPASRRPAAEQAWPSVELERRAPPPAGRRGRRSGCGSRRGGPFAAARGSRRRTGGPPRSRSAPRPSAPRRSDLPAPGSRPARPPPGPGSRHPPCRWRSRRSARRA